MFGGRRCVGWKGQGTVGWSGYSVKGETWPGSVEPRLLGVRGFANKSLGKGFQARARVARACSAPGEPGRLPSMPSGCEGQLGVALESLQGRRDLT